MPLRHGFPGKFGEPSGIRIALCPLTAGAAKLGISRVPQHPATLAACRLRSQSQQHAEGVPSLYV